MRKDVRDRPLILFASSANFVRTPINNLSRKAMHMEYPINFINLDDTLRYRVQVEQTLVQEDMRLSVELNALLSTAGHNRQDLDHRIRSALNRFIPHADWSYSTVRRVGEAVGYERVSVRANTRLPVAEAFNLEERARNASREGLALSCPKTDFSLPAARISTVLQKLRISAIHEVKEQIAEFERTTGRSWRIWAMQFGAQDEGSNWRQTSKGAYRSPGIGDFVDDEDGGLAGTERIVLIADVILKAATSPAAEVV